ncbi:FecR family protein [Parabacteroides sp. Marseille-P3160]|uniref:FecR family protein n=1 Tax=Parabacteroides sp. Marseille-P3160 TaxID=1917887 RepID=UPI0009B9820A|nr:FecR family protein [Parabacteroides sp. Marseille-P3160]
MGNFHNHTVIEDFLLDPDFNRLINGKKESGVRSLMEEYPDKKELIRSAATLLLYMKVEDIELSDDFIEKKYKQLKNQIKVGKRRSIILRAAVAACILALITSTFFLYKYQENMTGKQIFALLDSTSLNIEEISLSSGYTHVKVDENKKIVQTSSGDILIGNEEKMKSSEIEDEYIQLLVPNGKRTSINFSDGTIAWVNSGSKLIYPKTFKKNKREIYVDGEVYLTVAKETGRPFIVRTKDINVSVLGTTFNVSAYNNDKVHSIVLVEGSVEVSSGKFNSKIAPNQAFIREDGIVSIKEVDTYKYTCWKDGVIKLENETLDAIFKKISRYYNVSIQQTDPDLDMSKEIYKGKLDLNDSLKIVLDNLAHSSNFSYKVEDKTVFIE